MVNKRRLVLFHPHLMARQNKNSHHHPSLSGVAARWRIALQLIFSVKYLDAYLPPKFSVCATEC